MLRFLRKLTRRFTHRLEHGCAEGYGHHSRRKHGTYQDGGRVHPHYGAYIEHGQCGQRRHQQAYSEIGWDEIRKVPGDWFFSPQPAAYQHCSLCRKNCSLDAPSCPKGAGKAAQA